MASPEVFTDLRPIESEHPGYAARIVGKVIELVPPSELSEEERAALTSRMASYALEKEQT